MSLWLVMSLAGEIGGMPSNCAGGAFTRADARFTRTKYRELTLSSVSGV
jgi:hypothetical protein